MCALDWARSSADDPVLCRGDAQAEVDAALPGMERGLLKALRGIRATMAAAGYGRSHYRLVTGSSRESLHPNAYGQRAIGTCIGLTPAP